MPRDLRWTGGIANREWQRGTQPTGRVIDRDWLSAQVARYLADCRADAAIINAKYHPTEDGAVKAIFHAGPDAEAVIRAEYRKQAQATEARDE